MIESITLRNYRGHVATTVPCSPLTVLVGENASGKTSVLGAVRWVSEGLGDTVPGSWVYRGANELDVAIAGVGSEGPFQIHATYQIQGAADELKQVRGDVLNADGTLGTRPHALWLSLLAEELVAPSVPKFRAAPADPPGRGPRVGLGPPEARRHRPISAHRRAAA